MKETATAVIFLSMLVLINIGVSRADYVPQERTQASESVEEEQTRGKDAKPEVYALRSHESLSLVRMIIREAEAAGVSSRLALFMARTESRMNPGAVGDMDITCPHTGEPYRSKGLWQYSDCWFPDFREAFDPVISTRKTMTIIAEGGVSKCKQLWTSCRAYYQGK